MESCQQCGNTPVLAGSARVKHATVRPTMQLCTVGLVTVSPSAIRGNLVAHRPLDRSLSFPQAGIVNVVNSVSDTDPCRVSCRKAQEVTTGSEQVGGVIKCDELSQFVYSALVSSSPITCHLVHFPQARYHKRLLLCKRRMASPVLIPPDLAFSRIIILEPVL